MVTEELRIGKSFGGEEASQLYQVTDIEVGPSGEIYALSGVDNDVRVFSPTGRFVRSWGRQGEGPGEFQGPLDLAVARDTVAITDGERVLFFDFSGRLLNSVWPGRQMGQYSAYAIHATNLGWVVGIRPVVVDEQEPGWPRQVRYLDPGSGALGEAIIAYRDRPDQLQLSRGVPIDPAFSRLVDHGMDREGRVYLSNGMDYEILVYSTEGVLRRVIRMDVDRVPVTEVMLEEVRRQAIERCQHPGRRRLCERPGGYLDKGLPAILAHANSQVPVFSRFFVALDGHLLIERRDLWWNQPTEGDARRYDLISPAGQFVGRIQMAVDFRPLILRDERILGIQPDEFDVPHIVQYRVQRMSRNFAPDSDTQPN